MKPRANGRNTVGQQLPTLLNVTCWVPKHTLLHVVGSDYAKFETCQTFEQTTPNISFAPESPKRSATMFDPFTQLEATHAAHYTWSPWSLQSFMGCILPTTHCRSQQCWELLHLFARSLTSSSLRTYHSLRLKLTFEYFC